MSHNDNPLLSEKRPIPFRRIRPEHVAPGIREALARGQEWIDGLATDPAPPTWANLIEPLDRHTTWVLERIQPASHLMAVSETKALREAYNAVLPEITGFWARLPLHEPLWARLESYAETAEAKALVGIRARHLRKTVREFRRAGADLPAEQRQRLEALKVELAQRQQRFAENVLDATAAFELLVEDESRLEGVPAAAVARYAAKAEAQGKKGWLLTLDYPSVEPIAKHCKDRDLRREIFTAHATRCRGDDWDNTELIVQILRLRHELAKLLGYEGFPDYRLEDRMVGSGGRAIAFEAEMLDLTQAYWERDRDTLASHATRLGLDRVEPWDVHFLTEDLRLREYEVDDEMLRPYFPLEGVMAGLFQIVERVFGLDVREAPAVDAWHEDVRYFEIRDEDGSHLGSFYTDWFPRKEKQQGAWMNNLITGGPREGRGFDVHVGVICGNFTPPEDGRGASAGSGAPSPLLTHREVQTLFHEFGHLLHHCTSRVPVRGRAGVNVAWDWVELPSQFLENWTWEREALDLFARHHETGHPLPEALFERMKAARQFMMGWAQMRQISFGTIDLELHNELAPRADAADARQVMEYARSRFARFSPSPTFADYHVLTSFTHLFSGGYAAGYYSYLWSEVLDADAFTRFKEKGIFDRDTGRHFLEAILSRGDSEEPEVLFREFMGRDPDPSALLERNLGPSPSSPTRRSA